MRGTWYLFMACWLGCLLGNPPAARAQLKFDSEKIEQIADPEADTLDAKFAFKNTTKRAVTIRKIETSCGCLKAGSDKDRIEPGDSGVITGVFKLGAQAGTMEKSLKVISSATGLGEVTQDLRLRVTVPQLMEIGPKLLSWDIGEEPKTKEFVFDVKREKPIRVTHVSASREGFRCEVEEVEEGRKYLLKVTPQTTGTPTMGLIRIDTDCEIEKHRKQLAFFSVRQSR